MGNRPFVTLHLAGGTLVTNNSLPATNAANISGSADGLVASFRMSTSTATSGDIWQYSIERPTSLANAIIDAFEYTFRSIRASGTGGADQGGLTIQLVDSSGTTRGQGENVHEFFGTPIDAGTATYIYPVGPRNRSLFGGTTRTTAANQGLGQNILTFSQWLGVRLNTFTFSVGSGTPSVEADALDIKVYYTPDDPGASVVNLDFSAVTEVDAATAGFAIDSGQTEVAWSNPSSALVIQSGTTASDRATMTAAAYADITDITAAAAAVCTSVGHGLSNGDVICIGGSDCLPLIDGEHTVTVLSADTFSVPVTTTNPGTSGNFILANRVAVSRFLRATIPASKLGTHKNSQANQIRVRLRCLADDNGTWWANTLASNPEAPAVYIDDLIITSSAGAEIIRLTPANDVYGSLDWPIGGWATMHPSAERDRIIAIDASSLSQADRDTIDAGGFAFLRVRSAVASNPNGADFSNFYINGMSGTISFGDSENVDGGSSAGGSGRVGRLGRGPN